MKQLLFLCLGLMAATACKKDDDTAPPSGGGGPTPAGSGSIYITGFDRPGSYSQACYWKDGVRTDLTDGSSDAVANAIAVTDAHVYVAGFKDYAGSVLNVPTLWVDGTAQPLSPASGPHDAATGVAVFNGSAHVVGSRRHPDTGEDVAMYWHEGSVQALSNGMSDAMAIGVFVDASGVYIAGEMDGKAVCWHDGVLEELTDGTTSAAAFDIQVENGVVYVCGAEENEEGILQACLWVNGVKSMLTLNGGSANALHVVDGTVYVVGRTSLTPGDDGVSTYWVDGNSSMTYHPPEVLFVSSLGSGIWFDGTSVHTVSTLYGHDNGSTGMHANNTSSAVSTGFGKGTTGMYVH